MRVNTTMVLLGIETSCDDTSAGVVRDGREVLSCVVASQDELHAEYGGVVPELASRRHTECIVPVVEKALKDASLRAEDIDGVGVTVGPGLPGSLLVGIAFAKALAYALEKPLLAVNHILAHVHAIFLTKKPPGFPFVALVVSGGHTSLFLVKDYLELIPLGHTRDDAAGEAFDKVAKLLGLGYPGGVAIDRLAREGNPRAVEFKRPYISKNSLEFSFSGLKTAVLNHLKGCRRNLTEAEVRDVSASFQEAVVDVLTQKILWAVDQTGVKGVVVCGGVACNSRLRQRLQEIEEQRRIRVYLPLPRYCSDNGAMVAAYAYHLLRHNRIAPMDITAVPSFEE